MENKNNNNNNKIQVLLLGKGGREHAIAYAIQKSPKLNRLFIAPGNPGMSIFSLSSTNVNVHVLSDLDITNHESVRNFCLSQAIDLVIVGPEQPLVDGIVDDLTSANILCFGPKKNAAYLEKSKHFTKSLCVQHGIPTAPFVFFTNEHDAKTYIQNAHTFPLVIKRDGIAAGKGVTISKNYQEALDALNQCFKKNNDSCVLIESYLQGEEMSFFALCDGYTAIPFGTAKDYKRVHDNDVGPNTGGMGSCSPSPLMSQASKIDSDHLEKKVMQKIILPTLRAMADAQAPFSGLLYAGLMIVKGDPYLIEYNVRMGDPEAQSLLPRLETDFLSLVLATARHQLSSNKTIQWSSKHAVNVVMASYGYPDHPKIGDTIYGLDQFAGQPSYKCNDTLLFSSGISTRTNSNKEDFITDGGRVLSITGLGSTQEEARSAVYCKLTQINWNRSFFRSDIGH